MTVQDLVAELECFDPDTEINVYVTDYGTTFIEVDGYKIQCH